MHELINKNWIFQLTPSRRATINLPPLALRSLISTHALTEGDFKTIKRWSIDYHFNSRPHGGRPSNAYNLLPDLRISTHALTEGDCVFSTDAIAFGISTHAPTEGDLRPLLLR